MPQKNLQEATKENPCPHCGHPDWCYFLGNLSVCKRNAEPALGWIATKKQDSEGSYYYAPVDPQRKSLRPAQKRHWDYPSRQGEPKVRVWRVDYGGNSKPKRWQESWNGKEWVKGLKGVKREDIPIYRYKEIKKAIARGKTIFIAEGEPCCDALWKLGIPATTNIGGCEKWKPSDTKDLEGAKVVLCPDRDRPGVGHMEALAQYFPDAKWLYVFPNSPLWHHLPPNKGLDIVDWIDNQATRDDILKAIGPKRDLQGREYNGKEIHDPQNTAPDWDEVKARVDKLIAEGVPASKVTQVLNQLSKEANIPIIELRHLYKERLAELEFEEDSDYLSDTVNTILAAHQSEIALETVLDSQLAEPIKQLASWLNLKPEVYLTALLCGVSSLGSPEEELIINYDLDFRVKPNLFGALVARSSQKKSPIIKAMITKPLRVLQKKAKKEYAQQLKEYQEKLGRYEDLKAERNRKALKEEFPEGKPQEPRLKCYYFTNTTGEGLLYQVQEHPDQGLLYLKDELAGVFKSANQYRGGRGSDTEDLLSYYDGTGGTVLRANGLAADLDGLLLSVFGSIQPKVLQKMLGDGEDSNGNWARFIFVNQPLAKSKFPADGGKFDLTPRLVFLYEQLANLPAKQYRLDKEAFDLYRQAYLKLEDLRCDINTKPAMSHVWGKSEGRIGKIALGLHKINSIIAGIEPPEVIGRKTIKAAIALTNFYARQVEALYATLDGKTELPGNLAKILELAQRKGDYLLPRDVIINTSKKVNSVEVKQWFTQLADLGYGETQKTPRSLKFKLTIRNVDNVDANVDLNINITQASQNKNYSSNVDNVDNVDPFPDFWTSTDETDNTVDSNLTGSVSAEENGKKGEKINVTNIPNLEDETVTNKGINNVESNVDGESTFSNSVEHESKNGKKINITNIANLEDETLTSQELDNVDSNVDGESTFSTLVEHESKNDKKINITNITNIKDETLTSQELDNVDSNVDGESTFSTLVEHESKNDKKIDITNIANLEDKTLTSKELDNVDSNVDGESTFSTLVGYESKNDKKINLDSKVGSKKIQWVRLKDGKILNCYEYSGQFDRRGYIYGRQFGLIKKEKAHRTQVIEIRYGDE